MFYHYPSTKNFPNWRNEKGIDISADLSIGPRFETWTGLVTQQTFATFLVKGDVSLWSDKHITVLVSSSQK